MRVTPTPSPRSTSRQVRSSIICSCAVRTRSSGSRHPGAHLRGGERRDPERDGGARLACRRDHDRSRGLSDAEQAKVFVDDHGVGGFRHVYDTDGSNWQAFG